MTTRVVKEGNVTTTVVVTFPSFTTRVVILASKSSLHLHFTTLKFYN